MALETLFATGISEIAFLAHANSGPKYQKSIVLSDISTRLIIHTQEKQLPIGIIDLVKILNARMLYHPYTHKTAKASLVL
jgi:hypothetical protein